MLFLKSMKTNKFSFISFNIVNLLLNLLIFGIVFFYCAQISPLIKLTKSLNENKIYAINNIEQIEGYYSEEENDSRCEYFFDYVDINGEYKEVLYVNQKAYKEGLMIQIDIGSIYMFKFNKENLEENKIYTNDRSLSSSTIPYANYFNKYKLNNLFINLEVDCPYICVIDHIENPNYVIYDHASPSLLNSSSYNCVADTESVGEGKFFLQYTNKARELQMKLFVTVSIIPLVFSFLVLIQFFKYFIELRKDDILINYIYYMKEKKILNSIFLPLFLLSSIGSIVAILVTYLIFVSQYFSLLIIAGAISILFNLTIIFFTTKKEIKHITRMDAWREYND